MQKKWYEKYFSSDNFSECSGIFQKGKVEKRVTERICGESWATKKATCLDYFLFRPWSGTNYK